jgi:hypothetical protein
MRSLLWALAAGLAVLTAASDLGADNAAKEFTDWFKSHGGVLHGSLEFSALRSKRAAAASPTEAGLDEVQWKVVFRKGKAPVEPSERLLDVPAELVLTPPATALLSAAEDDETKARASRVEALEQDGFSAGELLALELLMHASNGAQSKFWPLIQTLPKDDEVNAL